MASVVAVAEADIGVAAAGPPAAAASWFAVEYTGVVAS